MRYNVLIKNLNKNVEEEVQIEVNGIGIYCFSNFHTPEMKVHETYPAKLELCIFDDILISEIDNPQKEFIQISNTFQYKIKGKLENGILDAGIKLKIDPEYMDGYWHLNGNYVEVSGIDRINIDFDI